MTIKDRRFIIDAGHGGRYDGAVASPLLGSNVSRKEKDVTLKVAQRVVSKLRASGGIVWPTRTIGDDINKRVASINTLPAIDYLVSIYVNRQGSGKGVFYQEGSIASKGFA
ncbi:N-acetylmuramoyl-L-alanine amidase [Paenibacillus sp. WLX2291]|uniref:N-acetylmuramoyl-L-alanine amidase n=1 Tax=Paenibacillus sp. WLX2291 TaxID=3296934 RepID=UPI0039845888